MLRREFPQWADRRLEVAGRVCENRVSILGHELDLGERINWRKDYLHGGSSTPKNGISSAGSLRDRDFDIKFVWELSRFHYGVALGQAFALTADERYSRKFVSLFTGWCAANPAYAGPNWSCAMEVAIRGVNLLWAGALLAANRSFHAEAREAFVKTLLAHGVFIYHNLEYSERVVGRTLHPVNGNHYLSDLAGLLHISCAFPEYRQANEWREFAVRELFREIRLQVDDDGVHYEYSPGYHRLVLEMILACLILLQRQGIAVPQDVRDKAVKMVEFIRHYRKPSGGVPLIRDLDSGRFCILGGDELTNHDHVLALGAIFFDRPDLYAGTLYEDCLWYLGPQAYEWHKQHTSPSASLAATVLNTVPQLSTLNSRLSTTFQVKSRLFPQSGFGILRQDSQYLLAACCPKGALGFAGHTHNDFLSFEFEAFGRTFLTDCGSYVYTQSPEWRNRFRSTASHNTVMVDGQEQNRFNPTELFEIGSQARPEVRRWNSDDTRDRLLAAYSITLPDGTTAVHERLFVFLKDRQMWLIRDRISGTGRHTVETRFHFGEGIGVAPLPNQPGCPSTPFSRRDNVQPRPPNWCSVFHTLCRPGPNLLLVAFGDGDCVGHIEPAWLSRSYANRQPISVLRFVGSLPLPSQQWYVLQPTRSEAGDTQPPLVEWEDLVRTEIEN